LFLSCLFVAKQTMIFSYVLFFEHLGGVIFLSEILLWDSLRA
jgi:hypothetical protein